MDGEDFDTARVSVSSSLLVLVILGNVRLLVYSRRNLPNSSSLKNVLPLLSMSSLLAGLTGFGGILISAWNENPLQGQLPCEIFSTFDHVFTGGANWMLATVAMERYLRLRAPAEHSSTFSARNLKILAVGMYILQLMIAVGPFYGLGEYTVYRGKMSLFVTLNVTSPTTNNDVSTTGEMVSLLRKRYLQLMPNHVPDPVFVIANYLTSVHHVIVARARWVDDGLLFIMRMSNTTVLNSFWESYAGGSVNERVVSIIYSPNVVPVFGEHIPDVISFMNVNDYAMLRDGYLPYQDLSICDGDFTSVNQHSDIWMAYTLLLTTIIPCTLAAISCIAICIRHFRERDKAYLPDDLSFSKALSLASWLCCGSQIVFITVNILFARRTKFTPLVLLSLTYLVHVNRLSFYFLWCVTDGTPVSVARGIGMAILRMFTKAKLNVRSDNGRKWSHSSQNPPPVPV